MPANRDGSVTGFFTITVRSSVNESADSSAYGVRFRLAVYINDWTVCCEIAIVTLSVKDKVKVSPIFNQSEGSGTNPVFQTVNLES